MRKLTEKQITTIIANIEKNTQLKKRITTSYYGDFESNVKLFIRDSIEWINAIENKSMLCVVKSVSKSGMSRSFYYTSFNSYYRQYSCFLKSLGYSETRNNRDCITVSGCGMDMNFNTNYNIIHNLKTLGFLTSAQCSVLSQNTPAII